MRGAQFGDYPTYHTEGTPIPNASHRLKSQAAGGVWAVIANNACRNYTVIGLRRIRKGMGLTLSIRSNVPRCRGFGRKEVSERAPISERCTEILTAGVFLVQLRFSDKGRSHRCDDSRLYSSQF